MAEYEACVLDIQMAIERKVEKLKVYGDSALVIYQLKGEWETRDSKLIFYHDYIKDLIKNFKEISFHHLPREENLVADALATLTSMFKVGTDTEISPINIDLRSELTHCMNVEEEEDGKPWYYDVVQFLKYQKYLDHASENDKKIIRRLSMNFYLDGEIL